MKGEGGEMFIFLGRLGGGFAAHIAQILLVRFLRLIPTPSCFFCFLHVFFGTNFLAFQKGAQTSGSFMVDPSPAS